MYMPVVFQNTGRFTYTFLTLHLFASNNTLTVKLIMGK